MVKSSDTWDIVFKTPEEYLFHVLITATELGIKKQFMLNFVLMSIGASLVSVETQSGRKFFSDALRLVL